MAHIAVSMGAGTHIDQVPQDQLDDFFEVRLASDPCSIKKAFAYERYQQFLPTFSLLFFVEIAMIRFSVIAFYMKLSSDSSFSPDGSIYPEELLIEQVTRMVPLGFICSSFHKPLRYDDCLLCFPHRVRSYPVRIHSLLLEMITFD